MSDVLKSPGEESAIASADTRPRHRFTFSEVLGMVKAGIIEENADVELIDGELIELSPENAPHRRAKSRLGGLLIRALDPLIYNVMVDSPLILADRNAPEPDVHVFRGPIEDVPLDGGCVDLAVEISDTTLRVDLIRKARLYAQFGIAEYWVLDVEKKLLWIHRDPRPDAYSNVRRIESAERISPRRLPSISFAVDDLQLERS